VNIRTAYIPKSGKATEVARILGLKATQVRGQFVGNVENNLTPEQAAEIAWVLAPERAEAEMDNAIALACNAVDDPAAYGITQEQADRNLKLVLRGSWAMG
jgi:hypothetical protein